MRITGKLIDDTAVQGEDVTIGLPTVDLDKVRMGDKLLVEVVFDEIFSGLLGHHKVVAHFPSTEKPGEAKQEIELPEKLKIKSDEYATITNMQTKFNALIDVVREIKERMR